MALGEGEEDGGPELDDAEVGSGREGRGEVEGEGGGTEGVDEEGLEVGGRRAEEERQ